VTFFLQIEISKLALDFLTFSWRPFMLKRSFMLFVFISMAVWLSDGKICAQAKNNPSTFIISQVQYIDANNMQQTVQFNGGMAQIPAVSVSSNIIVGGTYTPANATVTTTIDVYNPVPAIISSGAPILNNGSWSYTINANTLNKNTVYGIQADVTANPPQNNTAIVNNASVPVTAVSLAIGAN
jgi:hypothetical protein